MHLAVTRPRSEAVEFAAALERLGHRVTIAPLLTIEWLAPAIDLAGVGTLVATSRNAVRSAVRHPEFAALKARPLFAVGTATATLARSAGFEDVHEGPGRAQDLVPLLLAWHTAHTGGVLHLAGETVAFDLTSALSGHGLECREARLYRAVPCQELPAELTAALAEDSLHGVILMSPRTSVTFVEAATRAGLLDAARKLAFLCISEAAAAPIRAAGGREIHVAVQPNSEEMLALAAALPSSSPR